MKESCFQAEFQDLFIELPRPVLKSFIHKLLQAHFRITWRHDNENVELIVRSQEGQVMIPIKRPSDQVTVIQLKELNIWMEDLAIILEELITETKGRAIVKTATDGWIYVSCFDNGKIVSVMKIGGGEKADMASYRTIKKKNMAINEIDPDVKASMIKLEIDYSLMELADALNEKDNEAAEKIKEKLQELCYERERLKKRYGS
ncbi:hypothetical protein LGQ02_14245 [Bacillus shivajii]|uniref:hypothetical protein n=1 Tax=Bacillus shivajii TaxID=1983719 RepID=UPI001CFA16FE|nr:hypothetical protein [Bacillus shivajii]UCZ52006.1 hypothetical protein LGQ02_14245 [Bacillus shivajii]